MAGTPRVAGGRPHVLALRLSDAEIAALDAMRGGMSRADWFRSKIGNPIRQAPKTLAPPVVATPAPTMAQTAPGPIRTTASKIETVPETKHLFRRGKTIGEHYEQGRLVKDYACTCGCGEVRSG